ncbi:hypothetical protein FZZ91_01195 [Synechococcus sp. HB1133]|nr:hypothetical protein [Synechococcus sp. HB1133]MCB4431196.1 hypothetical protein [Synechococcus sp. HBA1120]NHI80395.1 hypothetical protein [Synechococcus sp. HB1133]
MASPDDQLEYLWNSPIGTSTVLQVNLLHNDPQFSSDEVLLRNKIGDFFNENGLSHPLSLKLMIANFLLSPPGLLQINNIESYFPSWFCEAYSSLYRSSPSAHPSTPPLHAQSSPNPPTPTTPDFGPFPNSLDALIGNRIHLNRLLGLSNLYYIDPDDSEITQELLELRTSLAQLIFSANPSSLESIWSTEFGDRYWSLVRSGIQNEPLSTIDEQIKSQSIKVLSPSQGGGFSQPNAINALLVSMMYFLPGTMQVSNAQHNIPAWLYEPFSQVFASS